jgi:hypothetical protein
MRAEKTTVVFYAPWKAQLSVKPQRHTATIRKGGAARLAPSRMHQEQELT